MFPRPRGISRHSPLRRGARRGAGGARGSASTSLSRRGAMNTAAVAATPPPSLASARPRVAVAVAALLARVAAGRPAAVFFPRLARRALSASSGGPRGRAHQGRTVPCVAKRGYHGGGDADRSFRGRWYPPGASSRPPPRVRARFRGCFASFLRPRAHAPSPAPHPPPRRRVAGRRTADDTKRSRLGAALWSSA